MNHDRDEALDALREIHARRTQILGAARPAQLPRPYLITTAMAFTAVGISTDLTVPLRPIVQLAALLCLVAAAATLTRGAPARPHRTEVRTFPQIATGALVLAVGAFAGAVAFRAGIPWPGSLGGLAAAMAWSTLAPLAHRHCIRSGRPA
ncbi:hypothetical protein L618_001600001040 [Rhodococcus rhodochrous J45]|uniref:Uncharacterized protein n=1 Tax=Rhodococcus rhodochrous J45 TaxID=935266 RepID=A0A562E8D0_RHORH|nr:hypothetical protein [Rhodococcus rhodochrous]TWH18060.1 hypothetical protein L618_001600001040 [Rhodococcus rhodochrous J45]